MKTTEINKTEQAMLNLQGETLKAIRKAKRTGLTREQVLYNVKVIIMEFIECPGEAKRELDTVFNLAIEKKYLPQNPI